MLFLKLSFYHRSLMKFHYHLRHESDENQRKVKKVFILMSFKIYFAFFPLMLCVSKTVLIP